jgi:hypothetical protein
MQLPSNHTLPPNFAICGGSHTTSKINTKRKKSSKTNQLMMSLIELCIIKTYDKLLVFMLLLDSCDAPIPVKVPVYSPVISSTNSKSFNLLRISSVSLIVVTWRDTK